MIMRSCEFVAILLLLFAYCIYAGDRGGQGGGGGVKNENNVVNFVYGFAWFYGI